MTQPISEPAAPPASDPAAALLKEAAGHFRAGRFAEAAALYRKVLALKPEHNDALLLLGFALAQGPELDEGEALLLRYLARVPGSAPACHALGKIRQKRNDDAGAVTWFEKAIAINPNDSPSWNDLGASLHSQGKFEPAIAAFLKAQAIDPAWPLPRHNLGTAYYDNEQFELAEAAYRDTLARDPAFNDAYSMLAATLERLHRIDEADAFSREYARRVPVAFKPCKAVRPVARLLLILAPTMCNARTEFLFDASRYETVSFYLRGDDARARADFIAKLPPFDIAFSAIADGDRSVPFMGEAMDFCAGLDKPVINAPGERIARTRRDRLPALLANIPNVVIPSTRRAPVDELARIAQGDALDPPLLVRPCGLHGGKNFERFTRGPALAAYLAQVPYTEYYACPYHDYRNADGYFRKYRFIFVDRAIYPYHLAIAKDWLVHYFRTDMAGEAWMRAEEERFLADYRQIFSAVLDDALHAIARTLDLDYAGIDCSIAPDGRLLVFEANAAMLVHLTDPKDIYPYKHRYVPRITEAIDRMVARRLGQA